jgi:hypothetical protein
MAQMAASTCQWFPVETTTASMLLSSMTLRRSCVVAAFGKSFLAFSSCAVSGSQSITTSTPGTLAMRPALPVPWPPRPMLAMRIFSFAPSTRLAESAVKARADCVMKARREVRGRFMIGNGM